MQPHQPRVGVHERRERSRAVQAVVHQPCQSLPALGAQCGPGAQAGPLLRAELRGRAPDGRTGKDHLGYLVAPHLLSVLTRGLTDHHPTTPRLQPSR
ncbi:hypothetical protein [Streptomyces sp. NPDC059970]|uniref:hypothetical protein n=1 Tax=Streptomyces sp. NPDC059970 TaxID=3347019 RepID=UPI00368DC56D